MEVLISYGADPSQKFKLGENCPAISAICFAICYLLDSRLQLVRMLLLSGGKLGKCCLIKLRAMLKTAAADQVYSLIKDIGPTHVEGELETQLSDLRLETALARKDEAFFTDGIHHVIHNEKAVESLFEKAIIYGNLRALTNLLKDGIIERTWQNQDGNSAAHLAAKSNNLEVMNLLVDHGFDCDHISSTGQTPLHEAAASSSPDFIQLLLSKNVNIAAQGNLGRNALIIAAEYGHLKSLQLLQSITEEKESLLNSKDELGRTPLIYSVRNSHTKCVEYLIAMQVNSAEKTPYDWCAVHYAAWNGDLQILKLLSQDRASWQTRCRVEIRGWHFSGMLPTHLAAVNGVKLVWNFYCITHLIFLLMTEL